MAAYNPLAFGCSLRTHRHKLGWSAIQLAALYAEFVGREDSPPDPAFIYHIERGTTIVSQERRAILASLVGMPLTLVGTAELDSSAPLDIPEYTQALDRYCDHIYRREGTLQQEAGAIGTRTNQLETAVLQAKDHEKRQLLELFGFYQILHADTWRGQQPAIASSLLSSTIESAKEGRFSALHVYALTQRAGIAIARFESTGSSEVLQTAIRDTNLAVEELDHLPTLYAGLLHVRKGLLSAYTARGRKEFTAALHGVEKGSNHIGVGDSDKRIIARLDEERCMLTRDLYSPMGDPKLGLAALQELELAYPEARGKRRLVQRHQLWAFAYLTTGDYPMAAAHLEAAVENAPQDYIESLIQLHAQLKGTSYGNNPEVGRLAVKIHQTKYPKLFS